MYYSFLYTFVSKSRSRFFNKQIYLINYSKNYEINLFTDIKFNKNSSIFFIIIILFYLLFLSQLLKYNYLNIEQHFVLSIIISQMYSKFSPNIPENQYWQYVQTAFSFVQLNKQEPGKEKCTQE